MDKRIQFFVLIFLSFVFPALAQVAPGEISGKIMADGEAVGFASVGLQGTSFGQTTNEQGEFHLKNIPAGTYVLVISAVNFKEFKKTVGVGAEKVKVLVTLQKTEQRLQEVVVSGTLKETFVMNSPIHVEVYTPKLFQKNPTPSIFEAMQMVNGVQPQLNCNVCNTGDIHINGMEGPYTMITIDGMPIVSSLGSVYGLSGIPNSMIQRVEVVKGPAGTLYGSEAVGGLINIITKNPAHASPIATDIMATSHQELNADMAVKTEIEKSLLFTGY